MSGFDLTKRNTMTKTNTKRKTIKKTIRWTIPETCDIWDTNYKFDNWEPEFMTICVAWQLRETLDSIRNSCDVCSFTLHNSKSSRSKKLRYGIFLEKKKRKVIEIYIWHIWCVPYCTFCVKSLAFCLNLVWLQRKFDHYTCRPFLRWLLNKYVFSAIFFGDNYRIDM